MKRSKRDTLALLIIAAFIVLLDQITKYLVLTGLDVGQSLDIAPWLAFIFRVTRVTNTGVAFGLFPGVGRFFSVIPAVVVVTIIIYCWQLPDDQWLMRLVMALPLGGAIGNLVDRLRQGFVVDFIDLNFWPLHKWPIFNLADTFIVTGVVLLSFLILWEERREQSALSERQTVEGS